MDHLVISCLIVVFFLISFLISRPLHFIGLKYKTNKILQRLHLNLSDLYYSLDSLVYFIQIPCHNPQIKTTKLENLYIKKEYTSLIYPTVIGLKVYLTQTSGEDQLVAYFPIKKMGFPQLTEFILNDELKPEEAEIINTYKAIHPQTMNEIIAEVHGKITGK
jgi:hypothetical protein